MSKSFIHELMLIMAAEGVSKRATAADALRMHTTMSIFTEVLSFYHKLMANACKTDPKTISMQPFYMNAIEAFAHGDTMSEVSDKVCSALVSFIICEKNIKKVLEGYERDRKLYTDYASRSAPSSLGASSADIDRMMANARAEAYENGLKHGHERGHEEGYAAALKHVGAAKPEYGSVADLKPTAFADEPEGNRIPGWPKKKSEKVKEMPVDLPKDGYEAKEDRPGVIPNDTDYKPVEDGM